MKPARKASPEPTVLTTVSIKRDGGVEDPDAASVLDAREAAVGHGDDDVLSAHLVDDAGGVDHVLLVVELVADEVLGLAHVGRHEVWAPAHSQPQGLAGAVEHGEAAMALHRLQDLLRRSRRAGGAAASRR